MQGARLFILLACIHTEQRRPVIWTCAIVDPRGCPVSDRPKYTRTALTSRRRTPPEQTLLDRGTSVWPM